MATLLLRLAGPLQAWGVNSKFDVRQTEREPSKSGVMGLLASAFGIGRDDRAALNELSRLSYGVRVEQEGQLLRDYHGAKSFKSVGDYLNGNFDDAYMSNRYYLSDAVFLAAVSCDDNDLLRCIDAALRRPAFPLYLGRRSCPPTLPVTLGLRDASLEDALRNEPWHATEEYRRRWESRHANKPVHLRIRIDASPSDAQAYIRDMPTSFDRACRSHTLRGAKEFFTAVNTSCTEHDAMAEVSECI